MKRIRIGNDIRVQTSLHDLTDFDLTSIKQMRCYFLPNGQTCNTSTNETYDPMQYNICNCGKPVYNVFPCNIDAPHWFCGYDGFGVCSKTFQCKDDKFLAPSRVLPEQNRIEAYFPAAQQLQIGEYRFVMVITLYQSGWCDNNLRTITLDEGVIFALTSDDRDIDADTIIDLDIKEDEIVSVSMTDSSDIIIGDYAGIYGYGNADYNDDLNSLTVTLNNETTREVTEDEFNDLFIAVVSGNNSVSIDEKGAIHYDKYSDTPFTVQYILKSNPQVNTTCNYTFAGKYYKLQWVDDADDQFSIYNGYIVPETGYSLDEVYVTKDEYNDTEQFYDFKAATEDDVNITDYKQNFSCDGATIVYMGKSKVAGETGDLPAYSFSLSKPITKDTITITPSCIDMPEYTIKIYTYDGNAYTSTIPQTCKEGDTVTGTITWNVSSPTISKITASYTDGSQQNVDISYQKIGSNVYQVTIKNITGNVNISIAVS